MNRYAIFLRGMNLGGRRITNDELCAYIEQLGFSGVQAFLASGNVVVDSNLEDPAAIVRRLEEGLAKALDYDVPTFVRTADELRAIAEHRPFPTAQLDRSPGLHPSKAKVQVALLGARPSEEDRKTVSSLASDDDLLAFGDRELYWLPAAGVGRSKLDWKAIEKVLGRATVRTHRTIQRLVARFF